MGGRYIDITIDRVNAARYGLNIADVQTLVSSAIGGDNVGEVIEGRQRFPINVRYPREVRDSLEKLQGQLIARAQDVQQSAPRRPAQSRLGEAECPHATRAGLSAPPPPPRARRAV